MPGYIWIGLTTLTLHAIQLPKPSLKVAWKKMMSQTLAGSLVNCFDETQSNIFFLSVYANVWFMTDNTQVQWLLNLTQLIYTKVSVALRLRHSRKIINLKWTKRPISGLWPHLVIKRMKKSLLKFVGGRQLIFKKRV